MHTQNMPMNPKVITGLQLTTILLKKNKSRPIIKNNSEQAILSVLFLFLLKMSHQLFGFHSQTSPCLAPTHLSLLDVLVVSRWGQESALMSMKPNICLHLNLTHYSLTVD